MPPVLVFLGLATVVGCLFLGVTRLRLRAAARQPEVSDGERKLTFAPAGKAWPAGRYRLVIDTRLEDVCGNRVGEPFEVDVFKPVERSIEVETVTRVFEVK